MSRWHEVLRDLRATRVEAALVQNVHNVQNAGHSSIEPFEPFEPFERDRDRENLSATLAADLLAPLFRVGPPPDGEPPFHLPCAFRRGRVEERPGGGFLHFYAECGTWGAYGYGMSLRTGQLGRWYCGEGGNDAHRSPCRASADWKAGDTPRNFNAGLDFASLKIRSFRSKV